MRGRILIGTNLRKIAMRARAAVVRSLRIALCSLPALCVSATHSPSAASIAATPPSAEIGALHLAMLAAYDHSLTHFSVAKAELDANLAARLQKIAVGERKNLYLFGYGALCLLIGVCVAVFAAKYPLIRRGKPVHGAGSASVMVIGMFGFAFIMGAFSDRTRLERDKERWESEFLTALQHLESIRDGGIRECRPRDVRYGGLLSEAAWGNAQTAGTVYYEARASYLRAYSVELKPYDVGPPDAPPRY